MDPLTIAASSAGLVVACVKIAGLLYSWIDDTRSVDTTVSGLCEEILALSRILEAVSSMWKQNLKIAAVHVARDKNLWSSVKISLDDCKATLDKLDKKVGEVRGSNSLGMKIFGRTNRQIRLSLRMKDIAMYRQRIQCHNGATQLALLMINVCIHLQSNANQDTIVSELAGLRNQIGRVEVALQSREALQVSAGELQEEDGRIIRNLQQYIKVAESFHSSASNYAESVRGGSIMGDPLSPDQWFSIERWIPKPQISEEMSEEEVDLWTPSPSPSTNLSTEKRSATTDEKTTLTAVSSVTTTASQLDQSDSESDIEKETTKKFQELALRKFEQNDYSGAETYLRNVIARKRPHGKDTQAEIDLFAAQVKLAIACSFQEKWNEVEAIIWPLTKTKGQRDINFFHVMQALALTHRERGNETAAVIYTKKALNGKKRILGKTHDSFFESMVVLAHINNDRPEAEVYRDFLPAEHRYSSIRDPLVGAFEYLKRSILGIQLDESVISNSGVTGQTPSRLVVGIDFGTTYAGVAFSSASDKFEHINVISQWPSTSGFGLQEQIPIISYYDKDQKLCGWGRDMVGAMSSTRYPKPDLVKCEWLRFQFDHASYSSPLNLNLPPLPPGKSEVDVVADYLDRLRESMTQQMLALHNLDGKTIQEDCLYYITVPHFCSDVAKAATRAAAIQSHILRNSEDRLYLISEARAAASYCVKSNLIHLDQGGVVLIIDSGGATTQLTALQLEDAESIDFSECTSPCVDTSASLAVNNKFRDILRAKLKNMKFPEGSKAIAKVCKKCFIDFEDRIKREFGNTGQDWMVEVGILIDCPDVSTEDGCMRFTNDEIPQCFDMVIRRILEMMENQVLTIKAQNQQLQKILLVGGFAASPYLHDSMMRYKYPDYYNLIVRPPNPRLVVLKGAVSTGIILSSEATRCARRHYLLGKPRLFIDGEDPEEYRVKGADGFDRCKFTYQTVVRKGQRLRNKVFIKIPVTKFVAPHAPLIFQDTIYTCDEDDCPRYLQDPGIKEIITFTADLSKRSIKELDLVEAGHGGFSLIRFDIRFVLDWPNTIYELHYKDELLGRCKARYM